MFKADSDQEFISTFCTEPYFYSWKTVGPLAFYWAPIKHSNQTVWMRWLIQVKLIGAHTNLYLLLDTRSFHVYVYSKTCVKRPLNKAFCKGSILQYFWPALRYNWSWKPNIRSIWEWPFYTGFTVFILISGPCLIPKDVGVKHTFEKVPNVTGLDKQTFSGENCQYFFTSNFQHMFWLLKRTVSLRRFF